MARGLNEGFVDGLARLVQDIARIKLAPDADPGFLAQLEQVIIDYIRGSPSTPGPTPAPAPGGQMGGMGELSRGPTPGNDLGPMSQELAGMMNG